MDGTGNSLADVSDFELHDFTNDPDFDQFINLISGDHDQTDDLVSDMLNSSFFDESPFHPNPEHYFFDEFNIDADHPLLIDDNLIDNAALSLGNEGQKVREEESNNEEDSLGTITTFNAKTKQKKKPDRLRTLISERRRRGSMKEMLYTLRSLVPNITKMDKASIVGDAMSYVQGLQAQAKKLKSEIADLEASMKSFEKHQESIENSKNIQLATNNLPNLKKIMQMDVFQVEEKEFHVRVVCNLVHGAASSLYKALESLSGFHVPNSNLTTCASSDTFLFAFTLNGVNREQTLSVPNMKLWIAGALLTQGFEFVVPFT